MISQVKSKREKIWILIASWQETPFITMPHHHHNHHILFLLLFVIILNLLLSNSHEEKPCHTNQQHWSFSRLVSLSSPILIIPVICYLIMTWMHIKVDDGMILCKKPYQSTHTHTPSEKIHIGSVSRSDFQRWRMRCPILLSPLDSQHHHNISEREKNIPKKMAKV